MSRLEEEVDTILANKEEELSVAQLVEQAKVWLSEPVDFEGIVIPVWVLALVALAMRRK